MYKTKKIPNIYDVHGHRKKDDRGLQNIHYYNI